MIRGQVRPSLDDSAGLEARIEFDILGANLVFQVLEVVVDTGFIGCAGVYDGQQADDWRYPAGELPSRHRLVGRRGCCH